MHQYPLSRYNPPILGFGYIGYIGIILAVAVPRRATLTRDNPITYLVFPL